MCVCSWTRMLFSKTICKEGEGGAIYIQTRGYTQFRRVQCHTCLLVHTAISAYTLNTNCHQTKNRSRSTSDPYAHIISQLVKILVWSLANMCLVVWPITKHTYRNQNYEENRISIELHSFGSSGYSSIGLSLWRPVGIVLPKGRISKLKILDLQTVEVNRVRWRPSLNIGSRGHP